MIASDFSPICNMPLHDMCLIGGIIPTFSEDNIEFVVGFKNADGIIYEASGDNVITELRNFYGIQFIPMVYAVLPEFTIGDFK